MWWDIEDTPQVLINCDITVGLLQLSSEVDLPLMLFSFVFTSVCLSNMSTPVACAESSLAG